ncbi:NAD-dependent epimerase/dehydratase family protein [Pseudoroseicyclus aestuarii]|uniref:UDP-glucose 4-epimerase n=1 Tax=Pseudoroseicyclus aestuarii TaxID=1795041 RepID=A0A318SPU8_9RHOB|nr:NAD(P)-dependent oxidoreductase [Pseudoroseicyclus aestuarii]PYE83723.1 UDP-glucose 4-epimerase [Pseudoroseicyclus aestuarii]
MDKPGPGRIAVIGADGFVGRRTVAEARAAGHAVLACIGAQAPEGWAGDPGITLVARGTTPLPLPGCDALIHAAPPGPEAGLGPLRAALDAGAAKGARLVLLGSLVVLASGLAPGRVIDESAPLESRPERRSAHTRARLAQEAEARQAAERGGVPLRILRAGAIYGPGHLWNDHLGIGARGLLLGPRHDGELPLAWVGHVAQALVLAATRPMAAAVEVIHVVDDDLPTRARFLAALALPPRRLPMPWRIPPAAARALRPLRRGQGELLRPAELRARLMPLRYDNSRLHALGWQPQISFEAAMAQAQRD